MDYSIAFWIAAAAASYLIGLSKGGVPAIGVMSVPIMALVMDPVLGAGLLLPIYLLSDAYAIYLFRGKFSVRNLKILIPAGVIGVILGYMTVSYVSGTTVKMMIAIIGFSYLYSAVRNRLRKDLPPPRPADVPRGIFWGVVSGLGSYISHSGGPPFQSYVLPQRLEKLVYVGTATVFFAVVNFTKLPAYLVAGQISWESVKIIMLVSPMAVFGAWSGYRMTKLVPERIFFLFVELALLLVSVKLGWEALTTWF